MQQRSEKLIPYSLKAPRSFWEEMDQCIKTQSYFADKHPASKAEFIRGAVSIYMKYHLQKVKPVVEEQRKRRDPLAFYVSTADGFERF
jgi:hypothetical protein